MSNSLISKKNLVTGKQYWCQYNDYKSIHLMEYKGYDIFEGVEFSANSQGIRVMFEGYVNTNKSQIPKKYLVPKRHYWCKYKDDKNLKLMRFDNDNLFYDKSFDVFWQSNDVKVIFENYEH